MIAYERGELDVQQHNLALRVRYLVKNIDEKEFKQKLIMLETKYAKETEIRNIVNLLTSTVTDIMYRFKDSLTKDAKDYRIMDEVEAIVEYANKCLFDTRKVFKMATIIQFENDANIKV